MLPSVSRLDKIIINMHSSKDTQKILESLKQQKKDPFSVKEGRFSFGRLKDSIYRSGWTEEVFLSDSGHKEVVSLSFNFAKLKLIISIISLGLIILLTRAVWLQIVKGDHYYLLADDNRLRQETIEAKRGIIYDRHLHPLVRNKANFVLYLRPIDLPKDELSRDELIREISLILDKDNPLSPDSILVNDDKLVSDSAYFYQIKELLAQVRLGSLESYQPLFIVDNIDYDVALKLIVKSADWPGVFISNKIRREYLVASDSNPQVAETTSLAHLLGYTGKISGTELERLGSSYSVLDYIGKTGLEYYWEKELRGVLGKKSVEVDAFGRVKRVVNEEPAQDGYNLQLSLDLELQEKVEEILRQHLEKNKLNRASVVILNPQNGEVLSLVSWPAFDNNKFALGISAKDYQDLINDSNNPLLNRAISGSFPAGSTIKPIFAAAALEEGVVSETTSILSTGGIRVSQWFFPDWLAGGHGQTNVRSAIANSVNTFFYYIGGGFGDFIGLGLDGLVKYSHLFGLGEISGIDLSGENRGLVPTKEWKEETKNESWYIGDTYHFAIGQGDVLVTPLQAANYIATIANGGTLYRPHLVQGILDSTNTLVRTIEPEIINQGFISSSNIKVVQEGMRQTVTSGSGRYLASLSVEVAAKTGTAQWSSVKNTHAWFVAYAPYDDPQLALAILLEEGGEGSSTATPVAYDIINWYFSQASHQ